MTPSQELQQLLDNGAKRISMSDGVSQFTEPVIVRSGVTFEGVYGNTIIGPATPGMELFRLETREACTFDGITFHSLGKPNTTGHVAGTHSQSNSQSLFRRCSFVELQAGIRADCVDGIRVQDCTFLCSHPTGATALEIGNQLEPDVWLGRIVDTDFLGPWEHGLYDHGHGIMVRGCNFNGPVYQFLFEGWSQVVNVNGTAVTLVSGPEFQPNVAGRTVQIEGKFYEIKAYISGTSLELQKPAAIAGGRMYAGTTGQLVIEGSQFDSGEFNYTGIYMAGPNTFYGTRISNNRFSNWYKKPEHHGLLVNMPQMSESVVVGNNFSSANANVGSWGMRVLDCSSMVVTGNSFTNYGVSMELNRLLSADACYRVSGNQAISSWGVGIRSTGGCDIDFTGNQLMCKAEAEVS